MSTACSGTATAPGTAMPNWSDDAAMAMMPSTEEPSLVVSRTAEPTGTPGGRSTGTDHHPWGIVDPEPATEEVSGSPSRMSTNAMAPTRSAGEKAPNGMSLHSMWSSEITSPRAISALANGTDSVALSESSHRRAAITMRVATLQRRYGGRARSNTTERIDSKSAMEDLRSVRRHGEVPRPRLLQSPP